MSNSSRQGHTSATNIFQKIILLTGFFYFQSINMQGFSWTIPNEKTCNICHLTSSFFYYLHVISLRPKYFFFIFSLDWEVFCLVYLQRSYLVECFNFRFSFLFFFIGWEVLFWEFISRFFFWEFQSVRKIFTLVLDF